ncbi:MAG: sulfatase family protein [Oceanipulchritudo sp.]
MSLLCSSAPALPILDVEMEAGAKNIILLLTDQLRQDYVGKYGVMPSLTPKLDNFCAEHVFTRCNTVNPVCQPARTALLTGRYTRQIGTVTMSGEMNRDIPTFAQALQNGGYHTIGVGKFHFLQGWSWKTPRGKGYDLRALRPHFHAWGFNDVWQVCGKSQLTRNTCDYAAILEEAGILEAYREDVDARGKNLNNAECEDIDCSAFRFDPDLYVDRVIGNKALEYLEKRPRNKPFFAQISFCCPHPPYDPPAASLEQFPLEEIDDFIPNDSPLPEEKKQLQYQKRRAYKAMIHEIDQQIGRIHAWLEKEGLLENTVIIFSSDHGEMMGDHGLSQKTSPYWQASRIPLYIRHPDYRESRKHDCLVENIDITATILDVAGIDPVEALSRTWPAGQANVPAQSLLPILRGERRDHRAFNYAESYNFWEMVESQDFKYIRQLPSNGETPACDILFDLRKDPNEEENVAENPEYQAILNDARERRMAIHEHYPVCQTRWTHL